MKLINGFAKMLYMTREDAERHAQNYFEIYRRDTGKGARTLIKRDCWSTLRLRYDADSDEILQFKKYNEKINERYEQPIRLLSLDQREKHW